MSKPTVVAREPALLDLEPGSYAWCQCGLSRRQPFCDGSHEGTSFLPVELKLTEKRRVALCQCKQTVTPPFCDGSHLKLGS